MSLPRDKNKNSRLLISSWFKLLSVVFYSTCLPPQELEVVYEGANDLLVIDFPSPCGIEVHEPEEEPEDDYLNPYQ